MDSASLYPVAPAGVPSGILKLNFAYRLRVVAVIAALFVFLLIYLVFVAAAGLLAYWLVLLPIPDALSGRGILAFLIFKFGGAFAAILLWLFLFKGLFSDDLFFHQSRSADWLRRRRKEQALGLPPAQGGAEVRVFEPANDGVPDRYRTHPTNHMREQNAKRLYVPGPLDDRSPWMLFDDGAPLRQRATELFYRHALERREPYEPRVAANVQAFIDAENAETTYYPKYFGFYDDRFVNPGNLGDFVEMDASAAATWLSGWPGADLERQMQAFHDRRDEHNFLRGLKTGELVLKGKSFRFREQDVTAHDVDRLFQQIDKELEDHAAALGALDRQVFVAHRSLARQRDRAESRPVPFVGQLPGALEAELVERYEFHMAVQNALLGVFDHQGHLERIVKFMSEHQQIQEADFNEVRTQLTNILAGLAAQLDQAKTLLIPSLTNVAAGVSLHSLIVDRGDGDLEPLYGNRISGQWIGTLAGRIDAVLRRIRRVHFKSLGSLLAYQEKLAASVPVSQVA